MNLPTLYQISNDVAALLESDDDASLDALAEKLPALEAKVSNVAAWVRYQDDMAAAVEARAKAMLEVSKALAKKADRARDYLKDCMERAEVWRITDQRTGATIALTKNPPKVVVDDEAELPGHYWRQPPPPELVLDKQQLLEDLKKGPVEGAHLEQGTRLKIV